MKTTSIRLLLTLALLAFSNSALAAVATYSCSYSTLPTSPYSQTYSGAANSWTSQSLAVTCTRVSAGSGAPASINITVTPTNGSNPSGPQNRASNGGNTVNYDFYTLTDCLTAWSGSGAVATPGVTPTLLTLTYYGCVPMSQPTLPIAATYTDTVSMTLATTTPNVTITGTNPATVSVSVIVPASCTVATQPIAITLNYTSFQGSDALGNTSYQMTCNVPYTMSLDAASGTIAGLNLNYTLGLNTTPDSGGAGSYGPVSGTGIPQTFYVNGSIAAGQSGTCAAATCPGSATHFITITY